MALLCCGAAGEIARAVRAGTLPRCARQRDSRSPGWQGHTPRPRGRTAGGAWPALARWGTLLEGSREPRRANDAALTGRELERHREPHAVPLQTPRRCSAPGGRTNHAAGLEPAVPAGPAAGRARRPRDGAIAQRSCTNSAVAAMRETTGILGARRPGGQPRGPTPGQEHPENRDPPDLGRRDPREPRAVTATRISTSR